MESITPRDAGSVIVIDDEKSICAAVHKTLKRHGYRVTSFTDPTEALDHFRIGEQVPDVVITDLRMPQMSGLELLKETRSMWPTVPVVLMTGEGSIGAAVEAMRLGAYDILLKPIYPPDTMLLAVERAIENKHLIERNLLLQQRVRDSDRFFDIVGASPAIRRVFSLIASVAVTNTTTLIVGESGTGKELVARAIHRESQRSGRSFVAVNCAAFTETLLESELFGHVRGAFTGAVGARRGLFEEASGGTMFLDEIGDLAPSTQVRLLRVLQEKTIRPIGSNESRAVDVRVVAATNRDLDKAVQSEAFRHDLYYRINVVRIDVPPLRERIEDLPRLVQHFIAMHAKRVNKRIVGIDSGALDKLYGYFWPGNVRELENVIERAIVLGTGDTITMAELPPEVAAVPHLSLPPAPPDKPPPPFAAAKEAFEVNYLRRVLALAEDNVSKAARIAGLDRSNFKRLLKRHEVKPSP